LEPLKIVSAEIISNNNNYTTDNLFILLKILTIVQLYEKLVIIELHKNKASFDLHDKKKIQDIPQV